MKAPARVLIISVVVAVLVIFVVLYRYDLLKGVKFGGSTESTPTTSASSEKSPSAPSAEKASTNVTAEQLANGKALYEKATCALCHSASGKADTPTGKAMNAADLTTGTFKHNKDNIDAVKYIVKVIEDGIPGTAMVSFKAQVPNEKDRHDLAEYVNSLVTKK